MSSGRLLDRRRRLAAIAALAGTLALALAAGGEARAADEVAVKGEAKGKGAAKTKGDRKAEKSAKAKARREALFSEEAAGEARGAAPMGPHQRRLEEAAAAIKGALKVARDEGLRSEAENAERLVAGQLLLDEGDPERAAIIFLDLVEGYADTSAGLQARFYLGEALYRLDMRAWAIECFLANLGDARGDAERFHQRSLARLLDLATPRQGPGFARRPGLSALPEIRGRLRALGLPTVRAAPSGAVDPQTEAAVVARIEGIAADVRGPELRYAYGRYLYFRGEHLRAIAELDALSPVDIPMSKGGPGARWRIRAAYLAATAALAAGEVDDALARFATIIKARPSKADDRLVVELAWLARARIHHDRGDHERALSAYRRIGRASPYYFTALYESAWVLLHAERYAAAAEALDRVLSLEPGGLLAPEIEQLRGKVKIVQGDLAEADGAFDALRKDFERRGLALGATIAPPAYFAAIAGSDMEGFELGGVIPAASATIAHTLPRALQGEALAKEVGALERDLADLRAQLARMEAAVKAPERARLFNDLAGEIANLDAAEDDLVEVLEALCARAGKGVDGRAYLELDGRRRALRAKVDEPMSKAERRRGPGRRIDALGDLMDELEAASAAIRAQLVAAERGLLVAASARKASSSPAFVEAVIEMRRTLGELEAERAALHEEIGRTEIDVRFDDPYRRARAAAMSAYRRFLTAMYAALVKSAPDPEGQALARRAELLLGKIGEARAGLDAAADARLRRAIVVLQEERANLDQYKAELAQLHGGAAETVGEVVAATYHDVAGEILNWQMRSEVGKLDVAWARKEAEAKQAQALERQRDRDQREIDRALETAKEVGR
ncbi:MAG: tetratricopeptide repeat protein [Myxococcales bacterium]|nr:tetratricopeptide repeat protein [Myxococcales bacterium]